MRKITHYTIVAESGPIKDLVGKVEGLLKQGWEPYWSPFIAGQTVFQAMVLKEEKEE